MKQLKNLRWWVALAVLLLALGHWLYWYRARVRPAAPDLEDLPAQVLLNGDFPTALWVPFPHQNLGALSRLGSSPQELTAAVAALVEAEAPVLPRFGPFPAPPSREMVLAMDAERGRFLVAARVYPGLAAVARLAGRMARNPWLGGGTIELSSGPVEIEWQGSLWSARTVVAEPPAGSLPGLPEAPPSLAEPALALARTAGRPSFLPAGWYRLAARGGGGQLHRLPLEGPELEGFFLDGLLSDNVAVITAQERPPDGRRGLALFTGEGAGENTGFAFLSADPARQLPLTGLGLAVLLGDRGYSGVAGGWSVLATSELSFRQGAFLVPAIEEGLEAYAAAGGSLELALAARPAGALGALRELSDRLGALGPIAHDERQRLLAFQEILRPLARFSTVRLAVSGDRGTVRLELAPKTDG